MSKVSLHSPYTPRMSDASILSPAGDNQDISRDISNIDSIPRSARQRTRLQTVAYLLGEQNLISNRSILPYTKELEYVKSKLHCSEHRLGDSENTFCWVDTSQPNVPHYSLCTQDLQEWAKYLVRLSLHTSKRLPVTSMNFSMMLKIQITPTILYPAHPILMTSARHARKEPHRFCVCPPSPYRPSSILTSISHLPSTTHVLLIVHFPGREARALPWLLNHSRGHLRSISRVMMKPMMTNHRKKSTAPLRAFILVTLL
jgi:hypothetical protein